MLPAEDVPTDPRTMTALGERVAVVETKVGALKEDTAVIRGSIHDIRGELQKIVATELRCAQALEAMQALMGDRGTQVNRIEAKVEALSDARNIAEGAWAATVRISAAIVSTIGILGVIGAGIAWSLGHVVLR